MFNASSYSYVMIGNGLISDETLLKNLKNQPTDKNIDFLKIKKNQKIMEPTVVSHLEFLEELSK